jgi:hypothetical protein
MAEDTKTAVKPDDKPKKRNIKKIIGIIVAVVVVLFVVIFIVANAATSAPLKVANSFMADIQADNSSAAYSLFTSAAQDATDPNGFKDTVDRIAPVLTGKPSVQSKAVNGETGSAATATVVYKVQGTDKVYLVTIQLQKENGAWKVLGFESTAQ